METAHRPFVFLTKEAVLAIHEEQLAHHGGGAGVRDEGLLDSALVRPMNRVVYDAGADCASLAAEYAFGLVKSHAFIDGNTRIAYVATELPLALNGFQLIASDEDALLTTLRLASGDISEDAYAVWIRENMVSRQG